MKNKRKLAIVLLLGLTVFSLPGCEKKAETAAASSGSASSSQAAESTSSEELPASVNKDITTSSNYYVEPAAPEESGEAEGYIPEDIPKGTLTKAELGKEFHFTEQGAEAYAVTIEKAEYTDRRSVIPGDETKKVLLITYSYRTLNGEPRLVDDMSFRLFSGEDATDPYNVSDQIIGDVSTGDPVTAEVCFSVPEDSDEFSLFIVDNTDENNENYLIKITIE